jgi:carboxyl-terminal processing protease
MYQPRRFWIPVGFSFFLALGVWIGSTYFSSSTTTSNSSNLDLDVIKNLIDDQYFDSLPKDFSFEDVAINKALQTLDPFSTYIPAKQTEEMNAPLEGSFVGIGVYFTMMHDTVYVEEVISGGPADQVQMKAGDRIVRVNGKNIAGIGMASDDVVKLLKGQDKTKVMVEIIRRGSANKKLNITRGKVPIFSIDAAYLLNKTTGYIRINKFSATTGEEFTTALKKLETEGMKRLILDLRGNGGGFLSAALEVAQQFLAAGELVTYTKGLHAQKEELKTSKDGDFLNIPLKILIDEGSASASEIVAGALQDLDRAPIYGRRSFGKGLVQGQFDLPSGAQLRLTVAKYYTPSGRCIQKDFSDMDAFEMDVNKRFENGEAFGKSQLPKGKPFKTKKGRTVYDGGGISPDFFIPLDTSNYSNFWSSLLEKGTIVDFADEYVNANKNNLLTKYPSDISFVNSFELMETMKEFKKYCEKNQLSWNEKEYLKSEKLINRYLFSQVGKKLFGQEVYIRVSNQFDPVIVKALN